MRNINKYLDMLKQLETENEVSIPKNFIEKILPNELSLEVNSFNHSLEYSIDKKKRTHYKISLKSDFNFFLDKFVRRHYTEISEDKSILAISGNTHNRKQNNSIVKIFQNKNFKQPLTLIIKKGQTSIENFSPARYCIIIENQDVFANFSEYYENIPLLCQFEDGDIIFGDGKRNTTDINNLLFNQYEKVYTFFDIDVTGFQMYLGLKRKLKTKVENLFLPNIEDYFRLSEFDINYDELLNFKYKNLHKLTNEDMKVVDMMIKYKIGIEQEIFKNPIKQQ